jgi:hypothetical protein
VPVGSLPGPGSAWALSSVEIYIGVPGSLAEYIYIYISLSQQLAGAGLDLTRLP